MISQNMFKVFSLCKKLTFDSWGRMEVCPVTVNHTLITQIVDLLRVIITNKLHGAESLLTG